MPLGSVLSGYSNSRTDVGVWPERFPTSKPSSKNIRVSAVSAGPTKTVPARGVGALGDLMKAHADRAPLHRNVDQLGVDGAALFLASNLFSAVTGKMPYEDCGHNIMGF